MANKNIRETSQERQQWAKQPDFRLRLARMQISDRMLVHDAARAAFSLFSGRATSLSFWDDSLVSLRRIHEVQEAILEDKSTWDQQPDEQKGGSHGSMESYCRYASPGKHHKLTVKQLKGFLSRFF